MMTLLLAWTLLTLRKDKFISHIRVYHRWDTIESIKEREPIKKMGELSDELCEILRKNND